MGFFESFRVALGMIALHKMRAFLTMLGVIIGVMSVTLIVMILNGFQAYMTGEFQKMGANAIWIAYSGGDRRSDRAANISGLKEEDAEYLKGRVASVDIVSAYIELGGQEGTYKDKNMKGIRVGGVDAWADELNNIEVTSGRIIDENDLEERANVIVIGTEVSEKLFDNKDPIGKLITFNGITLEVIGVMKPVTIMGQSNKNQAYVPISTCQDKWIGGDNLTYISVLPKEGYSVKETMDDVWAALMQRSGNKKVYRVDSQESILGVFTGIIGVAGFVLSGIAALSLLVGGIGIMNIMLVSVTERTKEIGLRKAVGARRMTVLTQFLVESAVLSLIGGLIGMGIAYSMGLVVTMITASRGWPNESGLPLAFPLTAAIGAMIFSAGIGVVFGLYPAIRASGLSPIEALRTE